MQKKEKDMSLPHTNIDKETVFFIQQKKEYFFCTKKLWIFLFTIL